MKKVYISLCIMLFQTCTLLEAKREKTSISDILQEIQLLQKELGTLQTQAQQSNPSAQQLFEGIQGLQDELSKLQSQTHDLLDTDGNQNIPTQARKTNLDSFHKVSDKEVKKAHDGPSIPQQTQPAETPINSMPMQSIPNTSKPNTFEPSVKKNLPASSNPIKPANSSSINSSHSGFARPTPSMPITPTTPETTPTVTPTTPATLPISSTPTPIAPSTNSATITSGTPTTQTIVTATVTTPSATPTIATATESIKPAANLTNTVVKTQSMLNGRDDFSDENQSDQEPTTLHVVNQENQTVHDKDNFSDENQSNLEPKTLPVIDQENQTIHDKDDFSNDNQSNLEPKVLPVVDKKNKNDANSDPDTKSHQSFFLGEGMVNIQALLHPVDAFDARSKKDKKIGSYKRSLNYVQGYGLGTLTIGKRNIQVLEDNASTRIPITVVIQKAISKKATAYIKNPGYNKMLKKSPVIINLYEYKP